MFVLHVRWIVWMPCKLRAHKPIYKHFHNGFWHTNTHTHTKKVLVMSWHHCIQLFCMHSIPTIFMCRHTQIHIHIFCEPEKKWNERNSKECTAHFLFVAFVRLTFSRLFLSFSVSLHFYRILQQLLFYILYALEGSTPTNENEIANRQRAIDEKWLKKNG